MAARETVTMREAAGILGVSPAKMWQLVKGGTIRAHVNPLDRREKLVRIVDIERLKAEGEAAPRPQPRTFGMLNDPDLQSQEIDDYLLAHWRSE